MDNNMILGISIYDNKDIDTESEKFKMMIADAAKKSILQDWCKIAKIEKYEEINNGQKTYRVNVGLNFVYE